MIFTPVSISFCVGNGGNFDLAVSSRRDFKGFSKMEKLSRNATDEGAKAYNDYIRRTLIRR